MTLIGVALVASGVVAVLLGLGLEWAPMLIPVFWAFGGLVILGGLVATFVGLADVRESLGRRGSTQR